MSCYMELCVLLKSQVLPMYVALFRKRVLNVMVTDSTHWKRWEQVKDSVDECMVRELGGYRRRGIKSPLMLGVESFLSFAHLEDLPKWQAYLNMAVCPASKNQAYLNMAVFLASKRQA